MAKTQTQTAINRAMMNDLYDLMVKSLNRNSKFYDQDADALWSNIAKKTDAQLRESLSRQRAIANVTPEDCAKFCEF